MSNLFSKLRDFVGLNDPADYEYEYDEMDGGEYQSLYQEENPAPSPEPPQPVPQEEPRARRRVVRERVMSTEPGMVSMNNVIGMPGAMNGVSEVVVMEPRSFEEMPQAIQALRERKSVVLNLTIMDPDQAQRAVDFVAGGTYAMDGHQERIGESIFLFTPNCVQVSTPSEIEDDMPLPQATPVQAPRQVPPTPAWASEQQVRMA
ncbi:MAG: cell division protein SepF [Leptolyngbyaceae cyanobacterium SM1_1_3]|nr:cell division protein SepF [Leptolyngbyaceae cyanobacterium SM1_1_3]NJM85820.1 cell division protein SepF [Leptolyngbyaceae cyanobacterium RM2_2_21]NJN01044.1 cell division protein SepF [Leptolyngbyaceae cyanobacterium RM1_1_2]NJO11510.1 cell division protein SepF [Leptolyngbyaceae cyanobacterium SL_1_1]